VFNKVTQMRKLRVPANAIFAINKYFEDIGLQVRCDTGDIW